MKSANSRWSCQLVRTCNAVFSKSGESGPVASRHLTRCVACREYFAAIASLDTALHRDALPIAVAPSSELHRNIMQAVARSAVSSAPRSRQRKPAPWLLVAGACAAFAFVLVSTWGPSPALPPNSTSTATEASGSSVAETDRPWSKVIAPVNSVLNEEPLQSEADLVFADARSAVRFLALNFLPTSTASAQGDLPAVHPSPGRADG